MILCANPSAQFQSYQVEIEAAVLKVMRGSRYVLGEEVEGLEKEFAKYIGTSDAIGVANGTDALELVLRALEIGSGDEVITVSHTAVATVAAIEAAGATPVLVDVDPLHYTMNSDQLEEVFSSRTRAVIAVHLYGQAADLDAIGTFCAVNNLWLVEDASQAHGACWRGKRLGRIGHAACFSCYPTKNLGAIGDAGLVTTSDADIADRIRMLREYGWRERVSQLQGRNSRLDELQAAILRVKLRYLDTDNKKRQALAARYSELLKDMPIELPQIHAGATHVFHLYVLRSLRRQALLEHLKIAGIIAGVHYPVPIHRQVAYQARVRTAKVMEATERLADEVISLPMYPELRESEFQRVVQAIREWNGNRGTRDS